MVKEITTVSGNAFCSITKHIYCDAWVARLWNTYGRTLISKGEVKIPKQMYMYIKDIEESDHMLQEILLAVFGIDEEEEEEEEMHDQRIGKVAIKFKTSVEKLTEFLRDRGYVLPVDVLITTKITKRMYEDIYRQWKTEGESI